MKAWVLLAATAALGCGSELVEPGELYLVHGDAPDPFASSPPVERVVVDRVATSGDKKTIYDGATAPPRIDLGQGGIVSFELRAEGAAGTTEVWGRSVRIQTAGVAGLALPLFVSRTEAFATAPGLQQGDVGGAPALAMVGGRYLLAAGGSVGERAATDSYDLGVWAPVTTPLNLGCPAPPCAIRSLAAVGTTVLAIGSDWAIWVDFADGSNGQAEPPPGLSGWAEIAGGRTVSAGAQGEFVVGPTRSDEPSNVALLLTPELKLETVTLASRRGAAATWVDGRGLVLVGGSGTSAGAEVVAPGATAGVVLPYPPDATEGAALLAKTDSVWRLGGAADAPSVELSLSCGSNCAPQPLGGALSLTDARAFQTETDVLVVGTSASANTEVTLGLSGTPLPLRVPRRQASALLLPTGHVAVFGGRQLADDVPARNLELLPLAR
jgi:hypothetical protein